MALGNAISDPYNMLGYADYAYQTGLIDISGWKEMKIFQYLAQNSWPKVESKIVSIYETSLHKYPILLLTMIYLFYSIGTPFCIPFKSTVIIQTFTIY